MQIFVNLFEMYTTNRITTTCILCSSNASDPIPNMDGSSILSTDTARSTSGRANSDSSTSGSNTCSNMGCSSSGTPGSGELWSEFDCKQHEVKTI